MRNSKAHLTNKDNKIINVNNLKDCSYLYCQINRGQWIEIILQYEFIFKIFKLSILPNNHTEPLLR